MKINTIHAHPSGVFIVNLGEADETRVDTDPNRKDPNRDAVRAWKGERQSWVRSVEEMRASAKRSMTSWINDLTGAIQNQYPEVVQKGWIEEEAMAADYLSDTENAAQLAVLTADATAKGRTPADHAARILEKANTFRGIAAQTRRLWLATDAALDAATDAADLASVLEAARLEAAPLARAYGLTA